MWILATDGDAFQGKKYWLPPGKKFLFGRETLSKDAAQGEPPRLTITDKTISRKHMTVEVGTVDPADYGKPHVRSRITVEDLKTKIGSEVNDVKITEPCVLENDYNEIKLGRHKYKFTFTWVPVNLTINFTSKDVKPGGLRDSVTKALGSLDVKILDKYESGITTHVVVKARNTPKGLQALVDGRHIVLNDEYLKALIAATAFPEQGGKAPLEEDWDANFPAPANYLPPRGKEPTERPPEAYAPNSLRQDMFDGYTFIFCISTQFESLLPVISLGKGKAILREVKEAHTTVPDFVRYVKSVAGEKGLGEFEDGSEGKGVVVVKYNGGTDPEWFANFNRDVALCLDHRLIEQNEFLDAILAVNASLLRRPLDFASSAIHPPSTATSFTLRSSPPRLTPASTRTNAQMAPPNSRVTSRRAIITKAKLFNDSDSDEEPSSSSNAAPVSQPRPQSPVIESQSQGLFVSQTSQVEMDFDSPPPQPASMARSAERTRKRGTPPVDYEGVVEEDNIENLAPTAAKRKKQRLEAEARGESMPAPPVPKPTARAAVKATPKTRKVMTEDMDIDEITETLRKKKEKAGQAEREREREELSQSFSGLAFEEAQGLVEVAVMEIGRKGEKPGRTERADESERWDDKWNGRKNFKKFRRRAGEEGPRTHRVIVPLQATVTKDYGLGREYWEDNDSGRRKKKSQSQLQTQSRSRTSQRAKEVLVPQSEESEPEPEPAPEKEVEASSSDLEEIVPPIVVRRSQSKSQQSQQTLVDEGTNRSAVTAASSSSNRKRAGTPLAREPPAKKAKPTAVAAKAKTRVVEDSEDEEDSDDGLKFKFRRK